MCHQYGYIFVFNKSRKGGYGRLTLNHYVNYLLEIMKSNKYLIVPKDNNSHQLKTCLLNI